MCFEKGWEWRGIYVPKLTDVRSKSYGVIVKIICIKLFWSGLRLTIVIVFVKMFSCNFIVYLVRKKEIPQKKMDTIENESITS